MSLRYAFPWKAGVRIQQRKRIKLRPILLFSFPIGVTRCLCGFNSERVWLDAGTWDFLTANRRESSRIAFFLHRRALLRLIASAQKKSIPLQAHSGKKITDFYDWQSEHIIQQIYSMGDLIAICLNRGIKWLFLLLI